MKRYLATFTVLALLVIGACATSAVATPTNMPARVARSTMAPKPTSSTEVASAPQIAFALYTRI
jgi:hypothetical protein